MFLFFCGYMYMYWFVFFFLFCWKKQIQFSVNQHKRHAGENAAIIENGKLATKIRNITLKEAKIWRFIDWEVLCGSSNYSLWPMRWKFINWNIFGKQLFFLKFSYVVQERWFQIWTKMSPNKSFHFWKQSYTGRQPKRENMPSFRVRGCCFC